MQQNIQLSNNNLTGLPSLKVGIQLFGKHMMLEKEWIGKFASQQSRVQGHVYLQNNNQQTQKKLINPNIKILDKINGYFEDVCPLCMVSKPKSQLQSLCNCNHYFCFSCLNSYAIIKIEDLCRVVCPHPSCSKIMSISSNVYKSLPEFVKIKFLQNKNIFQRNEIDQDLCNRCLEPKHRGQCKFILRPQSVLQSYKYRQCRKCLTHGTISDGTKKVKCQKCNHVFCFFCGADWDLARGHQCGKTNQIKQLQNTSKSQSCRLCTCDCDCQCDNSLGNCIRRACKCTCRCIIAFLQIICDCGRLRPQCILVTILLFPPRIIFSLMMTLGSLLLMLPLCMMIVLWFIGMLFYGICAFPCNLMERVGCPLSILIIICYPLVGLVGWIYTLIQTAKVPCSIFYEFWSVQCETIGFICKAFTYKQCC